MTKAADDQVDNGAAERLVTRWRRLGADVVTQEFPARSGLPHDVVDVCQPTGQPAVTYTALLALLESARG